MEYDLILKNITRHISLDEREIDFFKSILEYKVLQRNEFLIRAGDICRYTNFIIEGCIRVYKIDERGKMHTALFAIEDYWIADLFSFLTQTPAGLNLDALEDTKAIQISRLNMERLYIAVPKFERFFRIMHQNAFIALHKRYMKKISTNAENQYIHFRKAYPNLESRISQKEIAAYLGITPEFFSVLKKKFDNRS